ncbi:putative ADP-sugar pyrophosphatase [Ilyonectria robusta]
MSLDQVLPKSTSPYIIDQKVISYGKYQGLATVTYIDPRDETKAPRDRDFIFLVNRPRDEPVGTLMPNIYKDDDGRWCTILVQQFRPQYDGDTLEFPAGFISRRGGETAEQAAVREMEEETTKTGKVIANSPRLTSEPVPIAALLTGVFLQAEDKKGEEAGKQRLDKGEFTVEWKIPLIELEDRLQEFEKDGIVVDPRIWTFAMGIRCALTLSL